MKKTITAFILILAISVTTGQSFASGFNTTPIETEHESEILLTLISAIRPTLAISNSTASFELLVTCISSVNSIHATLQIQQWSEEGI